MNDDRDTPETPEEFDEALGALIRTAFENGVPVEGGWDVRSSASGENWTVEISRFRVED
jgi:hypothetical protein